MSRARYTDDFKLHVLTEFEVGVSVGKLSRDYKPCNAKPT